MDQLQLILDLTQELHREFLEIHGIASIPTECRPVFLERAEMMIIQAEGLKC